jgi:citrate lyase subunit beta/citryl-CoA lyase
MSSQPARLRRVQLAVPGSNVRMIEKAAASAADHVFLDLEDAVAPSAKAEARNTVIEAVNRLDWGRKTVCVRINDTSSPHCHQDVIDVVRGCGARLDTIMLPKAMGARDVEFIDLLLGQVERAAGIARTIGIEVLIEEAAGLLNVASIARASPRVEALIFGMGDYAASQGVDLEVLTGRAAYPADLWYLPRFMITMAARAVGADAIDGPYAALSDIDGYRREAERARAVGMEGKWALHPAQIAPALEVFAPRVEEVSMGRKLEAEYRKAQAHGVGATQIDGVIVDAATVRAFHHVLRRASLAGL